MENNWAAENLQTIRTLMERSAVYRRALAPISTYVGSIGIVAAVIGWRLHIGATRSFTVYWMCTSFFAIVGAFFFVRRQAIKDGEQLWSPPTRRVAQAMFPPLLIGMVFGIFALLTWTSDFDAFLVSPLVCAWGLLYGLALHSAGFFIRRGIRWFGWFFIAAGLAGLALKVVGETEPHLLMGIIFGASHFAYGIYLYFTEPRKNEA
jgi:hypothetical protein